MSWYRFILHLVHAFYCLDAFPGDLIRYSHISIDLQQPHHEGQYILYQVFLIMSFLKLCLWLPMSYYRFILHLVHVFYCFDAFPGDLIWYSHISIDLQQPPHDSQYIECQIFLDMNFLNFV